ncbi:MAG TPA: BON domain-containing protein [Phototrophicaceae bacterium]|nr:BON domain-containing protein [Phototrophicaceae bacterium]
MEQPKVSLKRHDLDIQAEVDRLKLSYPPLTKDRHSVHVQVTEGIVKISGHVQTPNTRQYFLNTVPSVPGVVAVDASELFDDESIRLEAGQRLPDGVNVGRSQYGNLVLVGKLPTGTTESEIVGRVARVQGVRRVVAAFED